MSNPTTNYLVGGIDLSSIFQPLSLGTQNPTPTGIKISNGQDLNQIFASYQSGTKANPTGFTINTNDLCNLFARYNPLTPFTSTTGQLSTSAGNDKVGTLASNFYLTSGYNYFNFTIYGSGGNGATPSSTSPYGSGSPGTGGGGAGAFIKAVSIPYSAGVNNYITSITYCVSGGGNTTNNYIKVYYTNNISINLLAGPGRATGINQGTAGSSGGGVSISNPTDFYSTANITSKSGTSGGNQGSAGISNGYTSSGSGNGGQESAPVGMPPTVSNTFAGYTLTVRGGGNNQTVMGYGAGGAATPGNYNKNATAYRAGIIGTIIYWLS